MEKKHSIENSGFMSQMGNPAQETVTYKIGGTFYEVSTSCGGSELLYDKMKRLVKSETVKTPADKEREVRYNEDSNLFSGVHYRRNEHMTANTYMPEQITALYARLSQEDALDGDSNSEYRNHETVCLH